MKKQIMFHGERVNWLGKTYQLFKDKEGGEHSFSGIKNVWFGSVYEMEDEKLKVRPVSIETDWEPTEKERLEYEAQKLVVRAARQEKLKAMTIKKPHEKIATAVDLIRPFYIGLSELDRRRFMAWFKNECSKKKTGRKGK